jgi:hypothetical protein
MVWLLLDYGLNLLFALAAVIGFWGIGRLIWRSLLREYTEDSLALLFQFAIGAWFVWTSIFLLGIAGFYRPWAAYTLLGFSFITGAAQLFQQRALLKPLLESRKVRGFYEWALILLCSVIVLLGVAGALTPPAAQDALVHHLAVPKIFIKAGRLTELPYNYFSYFPGGMEMLFLYGLLAGGPGMATLLHLSFGLAAFAAILSGGRMLGMSNRARLIAATAFLSAPTVWMEMTWAYIDLALTFYVTLVLLGLLRFRKESKTGWLYLSGFALGGALSLKYTALYVACILPLLLLFILREQKQTNLGLLLRRLTVPMIIALVASCPWYIRNLIFTSNPLFPFFLNLFPSHNPGWDQERARLVLVVLNRYGGEDKTLLDYLLVPFKLSFLARYGSDKYYQGIVGPFFFFSIPLLAAIKRARVEARYLLGFSIIFYLFWLLSAQEMRYLLPTLPALALAIATASDLIAERAADSARRLWDWLHKSALAIAMIIFVINTGVIFYYFNKFNYAGVFLGRVSKAVYLRSKFDYYPYYEAINKHTPEESRIFLIQSSNQPFYLERDYFSDSVFEDYTIKRIVASSQTPAEIKSKIRAMGMTHLLYRPHLLFDPGTTPFTAEQGYLFIRFLKEECQLLLIDKNQTFALFALNP